MNFGASSLLPLALLAPAAALAAAWLWRRRLRAAAAWASPGMWDRLAVGYRPGRIALSTTLFSVAVLASALALARPRWGTAEEQVERRGVDVVFVLDTSVSMAAPDVAPSRLEAARTLIRRMVAELPGHRMALILAEGDGVVMTPLTTDAAILDLLLDTVEPGTLPTPGTRLAPALELAADLFPPGGEKHRAVVVVSDGEDHGGAVEAAVERLQEMGAVVHSLGTGTPSGSPIPDPRGSGGYKTTREGRIVVSRLGEELLEGIARRTGGRYLRAPSPGTDPGPILRQIEGMEKRTFEGEVMELREERFQWPVGLAVAALGLHLALLPFAGPRRRTA